jgi:hypothetical protein
MGPSGKVLIILILLLFITELGVKESEGIAGGIRRTRVSRRRRYSSRTKYRKEKRLQRFKMFVPVLVYHREKL